MEETNLPQPREYTTGGKELCFGLGILLSALALCNFIFFLRGWRRYALDSQALEYIPFFCHVYHPLSPIVAKEGFVARFFHISSCFDKRLPNIFLSVTDMTHKT